MMAPVRPHVQVSDDWRRFEVEGDQQAQPGHVDLPPDIASAAFGLAVERAASRPMCSSAGFTR